MFCDNCGKELKENARFCPKCGQKVIALSDLESGIDSEGDIVDSYHNSTDNLIVSNNKNYDSKRKNKGFIVAICVLIIVIFVGLAVYLSSPDARAARQMKLGNKYLLELDYEHAVAELTKAIEIDPNNEKIKELLADAYVSWGDELVDNGELDLALAKIDEARDILGNRSEIDSLEDKIHRKQAEISEQNPSQKDNGKKGSETDDKNDSDKVFDAIDNNRSPFTNLEKGQYVTFGSYEQDNDLNNGKEPIEWEVLRVDGNRALLISRYVLDRVLYNKGFAYVTWETCTLRLWMNNDFYNNAFTDNEKSFIQTTRLENLDNQRWGTEGGNDTEDKVFCLSVDEIMDNYTFNTWNDEKWEGYCQDLVIEATPYALSRNTWSTKLTKDTCSRRGYSGDVAGKIGVWWWLRSPGTGSYNACNVNYDGLTGANCHAPVYMDNEGVRPAIWVSTIGSVSQEPINDEAVTENLRKLALDYYERHYNYRPSLCSVEDNGNGRYILHLYDIIEGDGPDDAGHTATSAWYDVDKDGIGKEEGTGEMISLKD